MRIALAQINPIVGDLTHNMGLVMWYLDRAREAGAEVCVFPELCVSGYPPRDLVLDSAFIDACMDTARKIGREGSKGLTAVFGVPLYADPERHELGIANSVVVYRDGKYVDYYDKRLLPTYDVFDEDRYFEPGDRAPVINVGGVKTGLAICEDLWKGEDAGFATKYLHEPDPVAEAARAGVRVLLVPSASPFVLGKGARHRALLARHAKRHGMFVASVNQVGGNDELVFDGHSAVVAPSGNVVAAAPGFAEHLLVYDIDPANAEPPAVADPLLLAAEEELLFNVLALGTRDYLAKTGFERAIIGLSGGIDSAVTAAVGVAALGQDNVVGVSMPGPFSSDHSREDASELADRLGILLETVDITKAHEAARAAVDPALSALGQGNLGAALPDVADENLQSRMRGAALMTLSNRTGAIVLTTGNKSETAVGYCTLYGDMNGGLAVLSDVLKTRVYDLARWMNEHHEQAGFTKPPIPQRTIDKPPSAELAPDQKDSDSLPDYEVLDTIVEWAVERRRGPRRIAAETGLNAELVRRVIAMIDRSEYKRRQAAPGIKVSSVAFGTGRRHPIAQGWRGVSATDD